MADGRCECEMCCNGEHPGKCKECAGCCEIDGRPCKYCYDPMHCGSTGVCPKCNGARGEGGA